jgi:hypothetical protein
MHVMDQPEIALTRTAFQDDFGLRPARLADRAGALALADALGR